MTFKHILISILLSGLFTGASFAAATDHNNMDHNAHMQSQNMDAKTAPRAMPDTSPLTEAGNDVFGTIQEVITLLDANPNTNWEKVDLEALRQHLIDMNHFTMNVDVLAQRNIQNGTEILIQATNKAADAALKRAMSAHPSMLESETGWKMTASYQGTKTLLRIETGQANETARLRALGYIGIMALGNHHQVHHWLMASGQNPHGQMQH